ncbi:MAG: hypothetical protein JO001_05885 [Alphaproteobacteria bacterium]|nr:hypothetical protein [Alphaproteobacteria bacterium]
MSDIPAARTEAAQRYVENILEQIEEQKRVIERLRTEDHVNLLKPAEDYLDVLLQTLESAREHVTTVSAAAKTEEG